jgi:hypothetical protein
MTIALRWAPTDDFRIPAEAANVLRGQAIAVDLFVDARPDPAAIGMNTEERINNQRKDVWLVCTPDDVGAFLSDRFQDMLQTSGISTVATGATRVIRAEVLKYFVTEGQTYKADVVLRFIVEDDAGGVLWEGFVEGHATRWGRSYNEQNYQESLGNAFVEATKHLLRDRDFLEVFRR